MFEKYIQEIHEGSNVRKALTELKAMLKKPENAEAVKSEKGYSPSLFCELLDNSDAKVRKNAALVMGMLREPEFAERLVNAYCSEDILFVKSSYLEALASYDYSFCSDILLARKKELSEGNFDESELKHVSAELKQLSLMFPEAEYAKHRFHNPASPARVVLTTGKDTIPALEEAVRECGIGEEIHRISFGVAVSAKDISKLARIRIYREMLFVLNGMRSSAAAKLPADIMAGNLMELLASTHDNSGRPFRFRITSGENAGIIAEKLQALSKGRLVNAPSDYEIEFKLVPSKTGGYGVFLKLHTVKDIRFRYRADYVAASMKPVNAAMMVYLVRDYLKENAGILDPFCGVGTVLIERNRLVRAAHIYGIDIYGDAVNKARKNTAKAGGTVINFINRDYFDFRHEHLFDEIITDMPVIDRESADGFYRKFFRKSAELLKTDGIIIMFSGEKNIIKKNIRINSEFKLLREFVFNEHDGLSVYVVVRRKGGG